MIWIGTKDLSDKTINGDFYVDANVKSLKGCPKKVLGKFVIQDNIHIKNLKYAPSFCNSIVIDNCFKLTSLKGIPKVNVLIKIKNCEKLKQFDTQLPNCNRLEIINNGLITLKGISKIVNDLIIRENKNLTIDYMPEKVTDNISISENGEIKDFTMFPKEIGTDLIIKYQTINSTCGIPSSNFGDLNFYDVFIKKFDYFNPYAFNTFIFNELKVDYISFDVAKKLKPLLETKRVMADLKTRELLNDKCEKILNLSKYVKNKSKLEKLFDIEKIFFKHS